MAFNFSDMIELCSVNVILPDFFSPVQMRVCLGAQRTFFNMNISLQVKFMAEEIGNTTWLLWALIPLGKPTENRII